MDRFDGDHPHQTHLMYVLDADTRTARWVSHDRAPHAWTMRHTPTAARDAAPPVPLPYGTTPRWSGAAEALELPAPGIVMRDHRTEGDRIAVTVTVASRRPADVITVHADQPVDRATIVADGQPSVSSRPTYPPNADAGDWPYELRFYDPPADGVTITLELRGASTPELRVSDATVGLAQVPGFRPRPATSARSPDHGSDLVVISRSAALRIGGTTRGAAQAACCAWRRRPPARPNTF